MTRNSKPGPARIAPLANLPLFHRFQGRKAVVVGSSEGARWKAELLRAAGAEVAQLSGGYRLSDLEGAAIAIADLPDREEAAAFAATARSSGAIVSLIDQGDLSDVQFGTIVNRSPVVIAISTDGASPMLGQSIRSRIEAVVPRGLSNWARVARQWRWALKERVPAFADRRAFWKRFVEAAWAAPDMPPGHQELAGLIRDPLPIKGQVTLVGAGPGDPDLLTLKALGALQEATVILYDNLVSDEVLELGRREARRLAVGKIGHGPSVSQDDINRQMVDLARSGERVVRLKGGDPLIFGRVAEELYACRSAGIDVSIIPGISAAQGAAASIGIPLTERKHARRLQLLTGHGSDGKLPGDIDWRAVSDAAVTTVLYMPRGTLGQFVRRALEEGLDRATPAAAIASATLPGEAHVAGTISEIEELSARFAPGAPVTVIIGWVARDLAAGPASHSALAEAAAS